MLGYKTEHKLLDICLRLDMMSTDEVRWTAYRLQEIRDCWVSMWHDFIIYFDCVEPYMPDRIEARRPANNRMYVVRNLFVEAPSYLLAETWTSVPAIPPSACTDDYMQWFLPHSHPRIQNPVNILRGFHVPADPLMPLRALLDLIAREARREDVGKEEKFDRMLDLLTRHYCSS
ncbi:hypothetical protein M9H77_11743 [Catharanthus roseus]|uniref:Uncharacterized protein n=1 Tax=Catharanthus roseus TaxID=4058 RepID=A0ACC0BFI8_CATRO|nr:hypothetical protein M9H77_11743 [Catharanthus roseus]